MTDSHSAFSNRRPPRQPLQRFAHLLRLIAANLTLGMQVPSDLSERLFLDQAKDFSYVIRAISLVGINTLGLIYLDFRTNPGGEWRNPVLLLTATVYGVIIWLGRRWLRRQGVTGRDATSYFRCVGAMLVGLGLLWSVLLVLLMANGALSQRTLIYAVAIGCIA
ncbi:MAG TPA: hypothetical protein VMH92_06840, partial [Acidocella sp.]|nr:hypothetical protein [Acidocella sp.]